MTFARIVNRMLWRWATGQCRAWPFPLLLRCGGDAPEPPDYAKANREAILTDIETLPERYAARAEWEPKIRQLNMEAQADSADYLADALLGVQREYGEEFVEQRKRELELADPESAEARRALYEEVMGGLADAKEDGQSTELSRELYDQVLGELSRGGELSDGVRDEVVRGVRGGQAARGNILGDSSVYEEVMELGRAGEQRARQRKQDALAFLTSGVTPDDVSYRREQQALGNVGSFLAGQTPTAQFGQLAGAQQGAAPWMGQAQEPVLNPRAGAQGAQFAMQGYQGQLDAYSQQSNPWMAGLGLGVSALSIPTGGGASAAAGGAGGATTVAGKLFG